MSPSAINGKAGGGVIHVKGTGMFAECRREQERRGRVRLTQRLDAYKGIPVAAWETSWSRASYTAHRFRNLRETVSGTDL